MKVLHVPSRLKYATLTVSMALPLIALHVVLAMRSPSWNLPWKQLQIWLAAGALVMLPLIVWIRAGKRWAFGALVALAGLWCLFTGVSAFRMSHPALGFFTAALISYWALILSWIRFEMAKSFFEMPMRWYQGHPEPVSGANCRIVWTKSPETEISARICRIDEEGLCAFANGFFKLHAADEAEMLLTYRGKEVSCRAAPMTVAREGSGRAARTVMGFQFKGMSPDARKELGDFVEMMRGEGHA